MNRLVVFLVEGWSERMFLRKHRLDGLREEGCPKGLLPSIGFWEGECVIRHYQGKQDLLATFTDYMRGWRNDPREPRFVVMMDRDGDDLRKLADRVVKKARDKCQEQSERMLVCIACRELEAWYLGDLAALRIAYPGCGIREISNPDSVKDPVGLLEREISGFEKPDAAGKMGEILGRKCAEFPPHGGNRSASFRCFAEAMLRLRDELRGAGDGG